MLETVEQFDQFGAVRLAAPWPDMGQLIEICECAWRVVRKGPKGFARQDHIRFDAAGARFFLAHCCNRSYRLRTSADIRSPSVDAGGARFARAQSLSSSPRRVAGSGPSSCRGFAAIRACCREGHAQSP